MLSVLCQIDQFCFILLKVAVLKSSFPSISVLTRFIGISLEYIYSHRLVTCVTASMIKKSL